MNQELFYQCRVLNVDDPSMLGRIRGVRLIDNYDDILKSISDPPWNEQKDVWTERDPFIFNSLLPYYVYQVPKVDEMVLVMYMSPNDRFINQYYIQSTFYSPTASGFQFYKGADKFMGTGIQYKTPKPLKNQDGTYTDKEVHKGVFPEAGDNAVLGRGSADLIVKENEVLLRAGKIKGSVLQPNVSPVANQQRGFLQISRFASTKQELEPTTLFELTPNVVLTNYLIEYTIINPENTLDKFTGAVYLYQLKPDVSVNSENIAVNSSISENLKKIVYTQNFNALSKVQTINFINDFIKRCNNSDFSIQGDRLFSGQNKFPVFYRPSPLIYSKLSSNGGSGVEQKNISEIYKGIKLNPSLEGGYGLIYAKSKVGLPSNITKKVIRNNKFINQSKVISALGGEDIYLLSHNSSIPGKRKINFDNTLYGISSEKFADEILPNTSSLVRGEELMELINLIVRFLVTHTHAYPGLPPVPITQDGTSAAQILTELQNAAQKILNSNIRLN